MIERCASVEQPGWLALRETLWPQCPREQQRVEMQHSLDHGSRFIQFVAYDEKGQPAGFVEASLRHDYVNGTETSPVAFLEGIYVTPEQRQKGVARELVDAVERWAMECGCCEFASDAWIDNHASHAFHQAIGFRETERVVYFRKRLGSAS